MRARVRKLGGWWTWYCLAPGCWDYLGGFKSAARASDDARDHLDSHQH